MLVVNQSIFLVLVLLLSLAENFETKRHRKWDAERENDTEDETRCAAGCVCHSKQAFCDSQGFRAMVRDLPHGVETIHFRDNLVSKIKYVHLAKLYSLKHLVMKGNRVWYIEPKAFTDLHNLISLSLTENNLRHIAPKTFNSLVNLQVFSLRKNKLRNIEKIFKPLARVRLLNLGVNRIKKIPAATFKGNLQLRVLDLHSNRIKSIHKNAFRNLQFLRFLVLRDNPLKSIELDFRQNFHLELLDLTNCQLTQVVKGMPYSINDLRLAENKISTINRDDFKSVRKVRMMVLNNNNLGSIHPYAFDKLWHLYALYIGANQLKTIPLNLPKGIGAVYANHNNITRIGPEDISYRPNLQTLLLRNNQITRIDQKAFRGLYKLTNLDLRGNGLNILKSRLFMDTVNLHKLDISGNPLQELEEDCFMGLSNLHILQMSSVGLAGNIQPSVFQYTKNLAFLDLSNSSQVAKTLTSNPAMLDNIQKVEDLNLMEVHLRTLPAALPKHLPHLQMIKLSGNPWHCDHKLLWLRNWMLERSVDFFAPLAVTCETPEKLKGKLIQELTEEDVPKPSIEQPTINLLNISKYTNNRSQKVFLGQDGKWYFYNQALYGSKGRQGYSAKKMNKVLRKMANSTAIRKPKPPGAFVVVRQTHRNWRKRNRSRGKGGRGREVAALNALVPEVITAIPPTHTTDDLLEGTLKPAWEPTAQVKPHTTTGTKTQPSEATSGSPNRHSDLGEKGAVLNCKETAKYPHDNTKLASNSNVQPPSPPNAFTTPKSPVLYLENSEVSREVKPLQSKTGQEGAVYERVPGESDSQDITDDTEESQEGTGASPLYDDSSGFVSGDEYLLI